MLWPGVCQERVSVKAVLWHRNKEHPSLARPYHLVHPDTGEHLQLHRLYR